METASIRLRLRVTPGAKTTAVVGRHGDAWKLRVTAPPERGRANDAVLDVLAASLALPRPDLRVVAGGSGRDKVVEVRGITAPEADRRLDAACGTVRT